MRFLKFLLPCFLVLSVISCSNALNDAGKSLHDSFAAPSAPALAVSDSQITAAWNPVPNVIVYKIYYGTIDSISNALEYSGNSNITETSCTITGLTNNTTYYIWVKAQYAKTAVFSPSSMATPVPSNTAPSTPVAPTVTPGDSQLVIKWSAVDGATFYEVYSNTSDDSATAAAFTSTTNTACTINGLPNGTPYYIWIKAVNAIGQSSFSPSASGTPVAPDVAPSAPGVPLITAGDKQLVITWAPVTGATSYEVYSNTSDVSSAATIFSGDSNISDTTCTITGLTNGTPYYIWVKAVNAAGSSPFSVSASETPVAPATPPSAPVTPLVIAGNKQLVITWTSVTGATTYDVYSSITNDSATATKFTGDSNTSDTTCTITGLTGGTTYYIWVKAVNAVDSSPFSTSSSGTPFAALAAGTLDTTFNKPTGGSYGGGVDYEVDATAIQSDGKILIGGLFTTYNGIPRKGIARLNADGSLDMDFDSSNGATFNSSKAVIYAIAVQTDGKILIGGYFTTYGGVTQNGITRLNPNGSYDISFNSSYTGTPGITSGGQIRAISVLSDNKILIGGQSFSSYNGVTANHFARLNSDGTLDETFALNIGTGADSSVRAIAVQTDGKIFIGGSFNNYNETVIYKLARLNANGTLDNSTFNPKTTINSDVNSINIVSSTKMIIGGNFTSYKGTTVGRLAQINTSDGSLDTAFYTNTGSGADGTINTLAIQTDGKILIGGTFTNYYTVTTPCSHLARLNSDGTWDKTFSDVVGAGPSSAVNTISLLADGNIIIGGVFSTYKGTTQNHVARVWGN